MLSPRPLPMYARSVLWRLNDSSSSLLRSLFRMLMPPESRALSSKDAPTVLRVLSFTSRKPSCSMSARSLSPAAPIHTPRWSRFSTSSFSLFLSALSSWASVRGFLIRLSRLLIDNSLARHIATSTQATRDFHRLTQLSTNTQESQGSACPPIRGSITLNKVSFAYPERPEAPVLKNASLKVREGECVAIVGASGSGKSTIAALLQRLYEPTSGSITIGPNRLGSIDVNYLRDHVAVVSQNPNLFDAPISENIAYGSRTSSQAQIEAAAKSAHVHDFIMSLPKGYETVVGENASLISGGQAQRIQIARALVRPASILILDECTSALDSNNQAAVLEAIKNAKLGRTTVMVTHKIAAMKICDRILVVHDGAIAETGTFDELMDRKGVFAQLASGGEWFSN